MKLRHFIIGFVSLTLATIAFRAVSHSLPSKDSETVLIAEESKTVNTIPTEAKETPTKPALLRLGKRNTVSFRGVVTDETVTQAEQELQELSAKLDTSDEIYLVLDTPGGSIDAGNNLIEFIQGLPQKVNTVSLFSASMGFHIVQSLNKRFVTATSTLMSHRAKAQVAGEIPGSLITRINSLSRVLETMDNTAASRMLLSRDAYREKIRDEYWVSGKDNLTDHTADQLVKVACSKDLTGEKEVLFDTFLGPVTVVFSACPVITAPLRVIFGEGKAENNEKLKNFVEALFYNKKKFVQDFIMTNKYKDYVL